MVARVFKLSAVLFLIAAVGGCSSGTSPTCSQQVAIHPGMTCLDVGLGWYHAQFASQMPLDRTDAGAGLAAPVSSSSTSQ